MSDEEVKQRSATDILLDLENKMDIMMGMLKSHDVLLKILSNKLSDNSKQLVQPIIEKKEEPVVSIKKMPGIKDGVTLNINKSPSDFGFEPKIQKEEIIPNKIKNQTGQITVSQAIKKDNQPLIMADVEIYTVDPEFGKVIHKKIKTTTSGKWTASLSPGDYYLKVLKKAASKRDHTQFEGPFSIEPSEDSILLKEINL